MPSKSFDPQVQQQIDNLKNEILDLQRMKAELRDNEERFQAIFKSMKDIYFEVDLGNVAALANQEFENLRILQGGILAWEAAGFLEAIDR